MSNNYRHYVGGAIRVFLAISVVLLCGCSTFAGKVANSVYPNLDQPWSPENAPTATTYPPSSDVRAVIGGRGEGLGCSIPPLAESLMFEKKAGDETPTSLQFRQACVFHDFCYRHGHATYGYSKSDCDNFLQQHAYRLCRQITASDPGREVCRVRARVVLLGVNLFGGNNFAHGHLSTYFEFDSFPVRADDYVAARMARRSPDSISANDSLTANLWTFYFKGGWMQLRSYDGFDGGTSESTPFLREKVPAPPVVTKDATIDRFVWSARRSLANTGIYVFVVQATNAGSVVGVLRQRLFDAGTENTKCVMEDKKNTLQDGYAALEFDCNAPITKVLTIDCGQGVHKTLIVAFGHIGSGQPGLEKLRQSAADICRQSAYEIALTVPSRDGLIKRHTFRLVNNEFIAGHFGDTPDWGLIALARGHYGDANQENTGSGKNFDSHVLAAHLPLVQSEKVRLTPVTISEDFEPLAPFRAAGENKDRLIGLSRNCTGPDRCSVHIKSWQPGGTRREEIKHTLMDFEPSWLHQPAYVTYAREPSGSDLLFFSRVTSARGKSSLDRPDFVPSVVQIESRFFSFSDGWQDEGRTCATIDIAGQIDRLRDTTLIRRYFPSGLTGHAEKDHKWETFSPEQCVTESAASIERLLKSSTDGQPGENNIRACVALRRNLAERWHRSQVIPGHFHNGPQSGGGAQKLDAVFVFNGFPRLSSVELRNDSTTNRPWAKPCAAALASTDAGADSRNREVSKN